jgi:hypothetical protein
MNNNHPASGIDLLPAFTFSFSLIRELRGAPITVLLAFILLEQSGQVPVTALLLRDSTGYGDHTVTDSIRALESPTRQLIFRVTNGWRLAKGFQLPLEYSGPNRDIRDSLPTTTTARYEGTDQTSEAVVVINKENRDIRGFSPEQEAIKRILEDALIGDPVKSQLIAMYDDPLYVLAHVLRSSYEGEQSGLLIHRLRNHDPIMGEYRQRAQEKLHKYYQSL